MSGQLSNIQSVCHIHRHCTYLTSTKFAHEIISFQKSPTTHDPPRCHPKRKNARAVLTKRPTIPSDTVFFYHLNVKPYDVVCQWESSETTVPTHVLLRIAKKDFMPVVLASLGEEYIEAVTFNCAEQSHMFFEALFFEGTES